MHARPPLTLLLLERHAPHFLEEMLEISGLSVLLQNAWLIHPGKTSHCEPRTPEPSPAINLEAQKLAVSIRRLGPRAKPLPAARDLYATFKAR